MFSEKCKGRSIRLLAVVVGAILIFGCRKSEPVGTTTYPERRKDELDLKNERLFEKGSGLAFNGTVVKFYPDGAKMLAIEVREGQLHGRSRGWFENGQMEVEEQFFEGVSQGERRRWYENGQLRSKASIVEGKIEGVFTQWHDNGLKAAEVEMKDGLAEGLSRAWSPSGSLKAVVRMKKGEVVKSDFVNDGE